ncbi:glycosyltransferase [Flavobacterium nitratireducens]|uniref:glycosyltransferase n=1 Tax=Flavobacterium nitratireducens TaxID=992289 RepID=UPI0024159622|nr:glycosyltransferase [Flavobacterium nitratireducens]
MKILLIINSLGTGGAEKLLLDTIPLYRKSGIEMDILVLWNNNHQFINALKSLGCCKVFVLKESGNYKDIYNPLNILKLMPYLRRYDIAHVHLFPAQYYTVFANLLIGGKCKLIFTEHNTTNRRIQKNYFKAVEKIVYSHYKRLVFISDEIYGIYRNYIPKFESRFVTINNGVNLDAIRSAMPIHNKTEIYPIIKKSDSLILQVSAFRPQKDQKTLIKAMALLPKNVVLLLVGDGETRKECELLVSELSLTDRVFFLGQRMDIPQLLRTVDVVVLSSKYEGMSLSSIEGMASGKPFIASNVPGLSDIVDGAGVLFECGNSEELASRIQEFLGNETLYEDTVKRCMIKSEQYDIKKMVTQHIELYKSVY